MKKSIILTFVLPCLALLLLYSCTTPKSAVPVDKPVSEFDKTRIVVLLKERVTPEMLVTSFEKYGLEKIGPANRTLNEWMFSWVAKVNPDVLLQDIQSSEMVEKAEFVNLQQGNN